MKTCLGGDHWRTPGIQKHSPPEGTLEVKASKGPVLGLRHVKMTSHTVSASELWSQAMLSC